MWEHYPPSTSWSSWWSHYFWLSHQYPMCIPFLSHSCYITLSQSWLDHSNYTWQSIQLMNPPTCHHLAGPNILLSTLFFDTFSLCCYLNVSDEVSHPYRITGKITVLYILIFVFLNSRDDKTFWLKIASFVWIPLWSEHCLFQMVNSYKGQITLLKEQNKFPASYCTTKVLYFGGSKLISWPANLFIILSVSSYCVNIYIYIYIYIYNWYKEMAEKLRIGDDLET
jgi:hypothetical protein